VTPAERVADLRRAVVEARSLPLSGSADVDRAELLARIDALAEALGGGAEVDLARREAEALRKEADDYVDAKLAYFEVALEKILDTVRRGRRRLAGESELEVLSRDDGDDHARSDGSQEPETR
jgi:hypothetical protein